MQFQTPDLGPSSGHFRYFFISPKNLAPFYYTVPKIKPPFQIVNYRQSMLLLFLSIYTPGIAPRQNKACFPILPL